MPEYTKHPESAIREFCLEPDNENLVILASQYLSDFAAEVLYLRDRLETVERERFTAENHRIGLMTILGVQSGSFSDAVEVVNGNIDRLNSFESLLWRFRDYYEENRNGSPNAMYSFFDGFLREINLAAMKQAPPVERPSENWIIKFEDPDKDDLTFTGAGAEEAARKSFRSAGDNWSCRLFAEVASTGCAPVPTTESTVAENATVQPEPCGTCPGALDCLGCPACSPSGQEK